MTFILNPQLEKDTLKVASTALSEILLMNDNRYPWLILVPRVSEDIFELFQLTRSQQVQLCEESIVVSKVLNTIFCPDKLNVATIGNVVRQLHLHCVARYTNDFTWPGPVWGVGKAICYERSIQEALIEKLRAEFSHFFDFS